MYYRLGLAAESRLQSPIGVNTSRLITDNCEVYMEYKTCNLCKNTYSLDNFYKDKTKRLGVASRCKSCLKKIDKIRNSNTERIAYRKEYMKQYRITDKYIESLPEYKINQSSKKIANGKAYRVNFPIKYKAHKDVSTAIRNKSLIKEPCEVCESEKVTAHHDDYLKTLDVRWLCQKHHSEWHSENGEAMNAR